MVEERSDYDSPWKEILEAYFRDFMQFFFPQIETEIAWKRGYETPTNCGAAEFALNSQWSNC